MPPSPPNCARRWSKLPNASPASTPPAWGTGYAVEPRRAWSANACCGDGRVRADGTADPAVLVAARLTGVQRVFKLGGAQAIAAMAYGTASIPACDKLFGPGNSFVTEAKQQVAQDGAAAIDMPAGPSEVLVIADAGATRRSLQPTCCRRPSTARIRRCCC